MSAAHSAPSQVRRSAIGAPSRPMPAQPVQQPGVRNASSFLAPEVHDGNDLKLDLGDIPRVQNDDMEVEGLKPSLLSRLLEFVAPSSRR